MVEIRDQNTKISHASIRECQAQNIIKSLWIINGVIVKDHVVIGDMITKFFKQLLGSVNQTQILVDFVALRSGNLVSLSQSCMLIAPITKM